MARKPAWLSRTYDAAIGNGYVNAYEHARNGILISKHDGQRRDDATSNATWPYDEYAITRTVGNSRIDHAAITIIDGQLLFPRVTYRLRESTKRSFLLTQRALERQC